MDTNELTAHQLGIILELLEDSMYALKDILYQDRKNMSGEEIRDLETRLQETEELFNLIGNTYAKASDY